MSCGLPDLLGAGACGLPTLLTFPHTVRVYPAPATESTEGASGARQVRYDGTRPTPPAPPAALYDGAADVQDAPNAPRTTEQGDAEPNVDATVYLNGDPIALGVGSGCTLEWVGGPTGMRGSVRWVRATDGALLVSWD